MRKNAKHSQRQVSIAISREDVSMVVVDSSKGEPTARGHHIDWLQNATSITSYEGLRELTAALTTLVDIESLSGSRANVTLSSDFCVTRVVAGENEKVDAELGDLRARSHQYLTLGSGEKAYADCKQSVDAKQTQAWMTVTTETTLNRVVDACGKAGLTPDLVEHNVIAACRALGHMGCDKDAPVILVEINHRGVELGVSYGGRLLFDYRPGGVDCKVEIALIVERHLERIQRYCNRTFRFAKGEISRVFLCGPESEVEAILPQFDSSQLDATAIDPRQICPDWDFDDACPDTSAFTAAVGTALIQDETGEKNGSEYGSPNLMNYYLSGHRGPFLPTLIKLCWPIAAAVLLAVGVYFAGTFQHYRGVAIEKQLGDFEARLANIRNIKLELETNNSRISHLDRIDSGVLDAPWHELVAMIGHSLPDGIWLNSMKVEQNGMVTIEGPSATEDLVFEFIRYLKQVPVLEKVHLEGQEPIELPTGPAIKFDVKCHYTGARKINERVASNG